MNKTRYARGKVIAAAGSIEKVNGRAWWKVQSDSDPEKRYNVLLRDEGLTCECYDFVTAGNVCKHCYAVIEYSRVKVGVEK